MNIPLLLISIALQTTTTPTAVKDSFAKNFPTVKDAKWEKKKDLYKASFDEKKTKQSVSYNSKGQWIAKENDLELIKMPLPIKKYLFTNYKGVMPTEATMITKPDGKISYEIELPGKELQFDEKGSFIAPPAKVGKKKK